ncbi:hypothetical protein G647_05383 [Cladophialophora carrionii CBS 160.54]|uniref:Uncharacterized protein n=1 Tax=Cladophialophora carrionii CBS 160.54 TaxID=1279043 RepID=V9DA72_9EURO|nr:uncharacterized protein G647_05383 [Cladophialophora carrionii CBS 160.54]ETI23581.1 hypothetical protein G647_05383 [Cladophialophora carrionii CBS 160.54]
MTKASAVSNEVFFEAIIKHCKEKPVVDYDGLATETNMSAGGAGNKVRAFLKELEEDGAAWANKAGGQATAGAKVPVVAGVKRKRAARKKVKDEAGGEETTAAASTKMGDYATSSDNEPPRMKPAPYQDGTFAKKVMNKDKGKSKEIVAATSDKGPANKKPARGRAPAKVMQSAPINNSVVEGEETIVVTSNQGPAKNLPAGGETPAKVMKLAPSINSGVEGKELSDAPGEKDLNPAKESFVANPETKTLISAGNSDENEDAMTTVEDEDDLADDVDEDALASAEDPDDVASTEDKDELSSDQDEVVPAISQNAAAPATDEEEIGGPEWLEELLAGSPVARFVPLDEVLVWQKTIPAKPASPWSSDDEADKDELENTTKE